MIPSKEVEKILYDAYNTVLNYPELEKFTWEEVQQFLEKRGYTILAITGTALTTRSSITNEDMEVTNVEGGERTVLDLFAVKPGQQVPNIFTSPEAKEMRLRTVFQRELKHKLLFE